MLQMSNIELMQVRSQMESTEAKFAGFKQDYNELRQQAQQDSEKLHALVEVNI